MPHRCLSNLREGMIKAKSVRGKKIKEIIKEICNHVLCARVSKNTWVLFLKWKTVYMKNTT